MRHTKLSSAIARVPEYLKSGDDDADTIEAIAAKIETFATETKGARAKHEKALGDIEARMRDAEMKLAADHGGGGRSLLAGPSVIKAFTESPQFAALVGGANSTGRVPLSHASIPTIRKDLTSLGAGADSPDQGFPVAAQRYPGVTNDPRRKLCLFDALPRLAVTSGSFEYVQLTSYTNAAAPQTNEGASKAEAAFPTELKVAKISTVAHWVRASSQVLADAPSLMRAVGNLLEFGVLSALESELITGDGTGGGIVGLLPQADAFIASASSPVDRIGQAAAALEVAGWHAGLVILHPNDFFAIASERSIDGVYIASGWTTPAGATVWGLPICTSASMPEGTALVLDEQQCLLLDRMQPVVLVSREDGSNFTSNMVTILGELRAGFAVLAVGAILSVDLEPASGV